MEGIGLGLASLAFWGFIAAVSVAGIWSEIRNKDAQHETMRRIVESGKPVDEAVIDKVFDRNKRPEHGLFIGGLITLFAAPGFAALGWMLSKQAADALLPLLGVAGLAFFVGIGLILAGFYAKHAYRRDNDAANTPNPSP